MTYTDSVCPMQTEKPSSMLKESISCLEEEVAEVGAVGESAELNMSCISVPTEDTSNFKPDLPSAGIDNLATSSTIHNSHPGVDSFHDGLDQSFLDEEAVEGSSLPVSRSGRCLRREFHFAFCCMHMRLSMTCDILAFDFK
jgi:hypothetical protein